MGQAIAAYAPNEYFAAISNPLLLGCGLISFCGVVVPYTAMQAFWKYWLYYLDPFRYLVGGLLGTVIWDVQVQCKPHEFTSFDPPAGQTCGSYMADFLASNAGYVENGNATAACRYCPYKTGAQYAREFNLNEKYYAWRDVRVAPVPECPLGVSRTGFADVAGARYRLVLRLSFASLRTPWSS
jgi:ABC-type multidrug transport system permease subunit